MELFKRKCVPCRGGVPPLSQEEREELLAKLSGWTIIDGHHLTKTYSFPDFISALEWVNRLGMLAEEENHHPDVYLAWGKVQLNIWTHKIDNLTESDFILAAKLDVLEELELKG